jgi:hypothetical protein
MYNTNLQLTAHDLCVNKVRWRLFFFTLNPLKNKRAKWKFISLSILHINSETNLYLRIVVEKYSIFQTMNRTQGHIVRV